MKYTAKDIEVFVLSYNRGEFIKETLESILQQTLKGFTITVIDNASTDNTVELLEEYIKYGINVIINESNIGGYNNFKKAQALSHNKWVLVFHDDDLLHPNYLEHALEVLNKDDVTMITSFAKTTQRPNVSKWDILTPQKVILCRGVREFVGIIMKKRLIPFCSVLYKGDLFRRATFEDDKYGKVADRPFVFDASGNGKIAILDGNYVQTRIHNASDSSNYLTGPFAEQWIELVKKCRSLAGDDFFNKSGRSFLLRGRKYLLVTLNPDIYRELGRQKYISLALEKKAITRIALFLGIPYHYTFVILKYIYRKFNRYKGFFLNH